MKNIILSVLSLVVLGAVPAHAAANAVLKCDVITNANGTSWESVASFQKNIAPTDMFSDLDFKIDSKYGDQFDVSVSLVQSGMTLLSINADIPGTNASITVQNGDASGKRDVNGNIASTTAIFTLKKSAKKWDSYSINCNLK